MNTCTLAVLQTVICSKLLEVSALDNTPFALKPFAFPAVLAVTCKAWTEHNNDKCRLLSPEHEACFMLLQVNVYCFTCVLYSKSCILCIATPQHMCTLQSLRTAILSKECQNICNCKVECSCDAYCGMLRRLVCRQNRVNLSEWVIVTRWLTAATEKPLS